MAAVAMAGSGIAEGPAADPVTVSDFTGNVSDVALGVEADGRVHVMWVGYRASDTEQQGFYSTSADGVDWTPVQVLGSSYAFDPKVAVDDARQRVHLMYRSAVDGIIHHTAVGGVLSGPTVVDPAAGDITVVRPQLAVGTGDGHLHALWTRLDWSGGTGNPEAIAVVASWNGITWSSPVSPLGDDDDSWSSIAAASDGSTLIAGITGYGVPKVALAADGTSYAGAELLAASYPSLEEDMSLLATWAPHDGTYHVVTSHFLWPGSSELYHYTRDAATGVWSGAQNLTAGSTAGWSVRPGLASVAGTSFLYATWMEDDVSGSWLQARAAAGDELGAITVISDGLVAAGQTISTNNMHECVLAADGTPHLAFAQNHYDTIPVYYLPLDPLPGPVIFVDGFESGSTSVWSP